MTSYNHNYLSKTLYINTIILGNRDSTYEFGGGRAEGEGEAHNSVQDRWY